MRSRVASLETLPICVTDLTVDILPHFIRHNFPQTTVDYVEIDSVVTEVTVEILGL